MQLVQCVDRLPVAVLRGVRHRRLEHPDQEERSGREQSAAECDQAVPGVLAPEGQPPPEPGTEEDQEEPDQGRQEQSDDLVAPSVVLPVRERRRHIGFARGVVAEHE